MTRWVFRLACMVTVLCLGSAASRADNIDWNNAGGGNWNTASNWLPAQVPGPSDTARIVLDGTYTVTLDVAPDASTARIVLGGTSGTQTLAVSGRTITTTDGIAVGTMGLLELRGSTTVVGPLSSAGTLVARSNPNTVTSYTSQAGSTLRVDPTGIFAGAVLTITNPFTNHGQIELTDNQFGLSARLNVTTGSLTNASDGTLVSSQATGGFRFLGAQLVNQGNVTCDWPLTLDKVSAAHSNSNQITVNAPNGGLTITQSGTTPSFTHTGVITVGAGRVAAVTGGTFNHDPGTSSGAGKLTFSGTAVVGLTLSSTSAITELLGNTTTVDQVVNGGTLIARSAPNTVTSYSSQAGSTLRVDPAGVFAHAILTITDPFTNHGQIELTDNQFGLSARLDVSSGSLTNASDGTIVSSQATGGARFLGAQLVNQGNVTCDWPLTLDKGSATHSNSNQITVSAPNGGLTITQSGTTPSFTHTGVITVGAGRVAAVTGGTFNHDPGTSSGAGKLTFSGTAVVGLTLSSTSAITELLGNTTTVDQVVNGGTLIARSAPNTVTSYSSQAGSTLRVDPAGVFAHAILTITDPFTNHGQIELTDNQFGLSARLDVSSGSLTNASDGTIVSSQATGGARFLGAQLVNQGNVTCDWPLTLDKGSATHSNSNQITVSAPNGGLTITQSGTTPSFTHTGVITVGAGRVAAVTGGTFNHDPGTSSGAGKLTFSGTAVVGLTLSSTSAITELLGNTTTVDQVVNGGTLIARSAPNTVTSYSSQAGSTLRVDPAGVFAHAILTITDPFTNHGQIELTDNQFGLSARLDVSSGSLTNASDGTIVSSQATGGARFLGAQLVNQGNVTCDWPLTLDKGSATHSNSNQITVSAPNGGLTITQSGTTPSFTHTGVITVGAGRVAAVTGGTFNHDPGTSSGAGKLTFSGTAVVGLTLSSTSAITELLGNTTTVDQVVNGGTLIARSAPNTVTSYSSQAGSTLRVDPAGVFAHAILTITDPFTNHGQIELTDNQFGLSARLDVSSGSLTNASDGTIVSSQATGGARFLGAQLENQGSLICNWPLTLLTGPVHNASAGTIGGISTLDVIGVVFTNDGTIGPGTSPGLLSITGPCPDGATSVLDIQLGGLVPGSGYDRLAVSGTATLHGRLAITEILGFVPVVGDSFAILTGGSVVDTFRTVSGRTSSNGLFYQVKYRTGAGDNPKRVDLIAGFPPPNNKPTAVDDVVSAAEDDTAFFDLVANDTDPDADGLSVTGTSPAAHGSLQIQPNGLVRYIPTPSYSGSDQFDYYIFDGRDGRDSATVFVNVGPLNDPPVFDYPPTPLDQTTLSASTGNKVAFTVQARDSDPLGSVTLSASGVPSGATFTPPLPASEQPVTTNFSWTPSPGQLGLYTLQFVAVDDSGSSVNTTVRIQVTGAPLTCGPGHHWIDVCPKAEDDMNSGAVIGIDLSDDGNLDGDTDATYVLFGPVRVRHENPSDVSGNFPGQSSPGPHLDVIDTEILTMHLTGGGITVVAGAGLGNGGVLPASKGTIVEQAANDSLGDSFFDVFFEVELSGGMRLYNQTPLRITNVIDRLPPGGFYEHPQGPIALYTSPTPGQGTVMANLVTARHGLPAPPPDCGAPHWVDQAPPGFDTSPSEADVGVDTNLDGQADHSFRLQGPVTVQRSAPLDVSAHFPGVGVVDGHRDVIDTEILTMELTSGGYVLRTGVGQSGLRPSRGTVHEQPGGATLADSFFDVFFEVELPDQTRLYNVEPLRVTSIIDCVPPHAQYLHPMGGTIRLYDSPDSTQGTHVANLVNARHSVGTPPPCDQTHWVDVAPAGTDSPDSEADVGIDTDLDGEADQSFRLRGPVTVRRSAARDVSAHLPVGVADSHNDVIDTEILAMSLTDGGYTLTAGLGRGLGRPLPASRGVIQEQANFRLADSFFDVFFEVMTPMGPIYNQTPLHVSSVIGCVPPVAAYVHPDTLVPLYDSLGTHVANLVTAQHLVGGARRVGECLISGPDSSLCGMRNVYRVTSNTAGDTILWRVSGDGEIDGPDNLDSVVVIGQTPKSYLITVTVSDSLTVATCTKVIGVGTCNTGTLIALFQAQPLEHGVELRWQLGEPAQIAEIRLERAEQATGPWSVVGTERRIDGGVVVAFDGGVEMGRSYLYRLAATTTGGEALIFGPITVTAGMPITEFALGAPMPNPTNVRTRVEFTLPREAPIELVIVDVLGRTVGTLAKGAHRPGRYQAVWSGEIDGGRAPAGLYFFRYRTPDRTMVRRIAVVR